MIYYSIFLLMSIDEKINNIFKLPISYNKKTKQLNESIESDLELTKTVDDLERPIYNYIFKPTNTFGKIINKTIAKEYTTDINFLKETQKLLSKYSISKKKISIEDDKIEKIYKSWNEIKGETGFCEKYLYIDWEFGKFLNKNEHFLQIMSIYNIASPLLSLMIPIFILIIPFFVIKIKGIELSMEQYVSVIKTLIANHAIGKIFTNYNNVDTQQKIYLLVSAAFYVFSIYQNILVCIRFYSNMKKIHDYIFKFREYIELTLEKMEFYLDITNKYKGYNEFNDNTKSHKTILEGLNSKLERVSEFKLSFLKFYEIGDIMKIFYDLYEDTVYESSFLFSFGFNGYMNNIEGLVYQIKNKQINNATFKKNKNKLTKPKFKHMYYPKFIDTNAIKNDCDLKKNMIITGPNASGKTTTLKSIIINIILSQQFGCGCYEELIFMPYEYIHCYLNIPDTSGRDSLFQAEARRCKEIIDCINKKTKSTHFCIFDELYSGTNPEEAVASALAFMNYIIKNKNVTCILTTHYMELCKKLDENDRIKNYNMKTVQDNNLLDYTYLLVEGISNIKGGLKVLEEMNYPKEILDNTEI